MFENYTFDLKSQPYFPGVNEFMTEIVFRHLPNIWLVTCVTLKLLFEYEIYAKFSLICTHWVMM